MSDEESEHVLEQEEQSQELLPKWFTTLEPTNIKRAKENYAVLKLFDLSPLEKAARTNCRGVDDYKKFLAIRAALPGIDTDLSPTDDMDAVWHAHILDTVSYQRCCGALLGTGNLVHHNPYTGDDLAMRQARRELLKKVWGDVFEDAPALGWGVDPSACETYERRLTGRKRRRRSSHEYQIFVKLLTGRTTTLEVDHQTEVEDLKLMLYDRNEAPLPQMRLIFAGTQLEDGKTMRDYKIYKESTVHMVLRMAGC